MDPSTTILTDLSFYITIIEDSWKTVCENGVNLDSYGRLRRGRQPFLQQDIQSVFKVRMVVLYAISNLLIMLTKGTFHHDCRGCPPIELDTENDTEGKTMSP